MSASNALRLNQHQDVNLFKEAVTFTAARTGFAPVLIEKDYFCSVMLAYLSHASQTKLVFKGGTCLAKVHAGFYRLSEDLDFAVPMPVDSRRSERRREVDPVKRILERLVYDVPDIKEEALTGANDSRQYVGILSYDSLIQNRREVIKIEVSLREPLLQPAVRCDAATLLLDPISQRTWLPPVPFPAITKTEAFAEKFRAAMTRREPAIRDFFDIDYGVQRLDINPTDASLIRAVRQKIAVPGNESIEVSIRRLTSLRNQLESRLKPVLRLADFENFDLDRAFSIVELHRIVNEAIRAAAPGDDHAEGLTVDLSKIDFAKLRDEFAKKVHRKHAALQDIRDVVEKKLAEMLAHNPLRMDYYKRYQEIIADYNREKDRATVETTFAQLVELAGRLDAEQRRAAEEGLSDSELALFDLLFKENINKTDRERLKQASKGLLASLRELVTPMHDWTQNTATQAEVRIFILDSLYQTLPRPPFTEEETEVVASRVYDYVWQRSVSGQSLVAA